MDPLADPPAGWQVWHAEEAGRVVLAYRPDVFDGEAFPSECLPTLTVSPGGSPDARPEERVRADRWHVALYLEPDVRIRSADGGFDSRDAAVEQAVTEAERFTAGELDYRGAYLEPREAYLDELDALVGSDG